MQPSQQDFSFDLDRTLSAVVAVRAQVPEDALTANVLGTEREGHGVLISDDGLIVTIGYLITEAESVWIADGRGAVVPGYVVGYDQDTGFGLVKPTQPLKLPTIELGEVADLSADDPVVVAGHGGLEQSIVARVIGKREFAGYWEYVLDEAIFTAPAHPNWGGTGLLGEDGRLYGIGSLLVQHEDRTGEQAGANMFVPIDLLKPIIDDLCAFGRPNRPARPWLGFLVQEVNQDLVISAVYEDCPAHTAGLEPGDVIVSVEGEHVGDLAGLFRRIWSLGDAGVAVPFTINRENERHDAIVTTIDRNERLRSGLLH